MCILFRFIGLESILKCQSTTTTSTSTAAAASSSERHLTVHMSDYRLEFYTSSSSSLDRTSNSPSVIRRGAVSLPIYVDPGSVEFHIQASPTSPQSEYRLGVKAKMKGCCGGERQARTTRVELAARKSLSASTNDLNLLTNDEQSSSLLVDSVNRIVITDH